MLLFLLAGLVQPALAREAPGPGASPVVNALAQRIDSDRPNAVALLRAALADQQGMALPDRLWALSQLAKALSKALKHDEALTVIRQGQKEAAAIPVQQVYFARQATLYFNNRGNNQLALAEYALIAPMLATLSGTSGELEAELQAAHAWLAGGTVMSGLGQLPEAMDLLVRAMAVFDKRPGQAKGQAESINQIAHVRYKTGDVSAALREVQRAINIAEAAKLTEELARLYMRQAHFLSSTGNVDAQHDALMRARALSQKDNSPFNLAVIATNLADVALQRKDYAAVLRFVDEAIPLVNKSGDRESLLVCWINQGIAMNRLGQPGGLALIKKAIDEFTVTTGKKGVAAEVQGTLAEELAFNGDYQKAYAAAMDFKKRTDEVRSAKDQKRIADSAARYQTDKQQRQIEVLEQEQRGQKRMQMLWILAGALGLLATVILLISRFYLQRAYRKVAEMSLSDPLTGLRNRRYLASRIDEDLAQNVRQTFPPVPGFETDARRNTDIVFIMIDLDHFKRVNDEHGHAAGDAVLKQFSAILMEEVRDSDTVVRWGGEEFLIVAKQAACAEIHLFAERIRARVAGHPFDLGNGERLSKTCSIGYASYPAIEADQPQPRWEDVVALADQCLYAAKASGRDMWVGIVGCDTLAEVPRQIDLNACLKDGGGELQHSEGRAVVWPHAPH